MHNVKKSINSISLDDAWSTTSEFLRKSNKIGYTKL
jgi:hypothetical protein